MKLCLIRNEIADLNAEPVLKNYSLSQLKRVTDILIIDDDPFTYGQYILGKPANGLGNRAIYQPAAS